MVIICSDWIDVGVQVCVPRIMILCQKTEMLNLGKHQVIAQEKTTTGNSSFIIS
jgi:hypothetical protein